MRKGEAVLRHQGVALSRVNRRPWSETEEPPGCFLNGDFESVSLEPLIEKYSALEIVNSGILERIGSFSMGDANQKAIIILNSFISILAIAYEEALVDIRAYLQPV